MYSRCPRHPISQSGIAAAQTHFIRQIPADRWAAA
jgi:hypothetical protein